MPPLTPPPDPNPRTPRLRAPRGSVDCQIHLFGPAADYPFDPRSKYVSLDMLPEDSIRVQDALGLDHAVIVSGGGYGTDTRHLRDTLRRFPDRFRGVALLPDDVGEAEFADLHALGVRGVRFVSPRHGTHLPQITERVAAVAAELGWVVQFYPGRGELENFADRLLSLPGHLVLDHFAALEAARGTDQPAFRALLRMLDTGRVWVRLSGPMRCTDEEFPYPSVTPIARALVAHAPERLVWGSDWPHVNMRGRVMPNDGDLLDLLLDWAPEVDVRNRILSDVARALYDVPAPAGASSGK